ncbi:MAG: alpha/beta fold hydrolase, partial [Actinomycetes bacterium]
EREVIAIDLPGFGDSSQFESTPTPSALADSVEGLICELGLGKPAVGGNSLGGLISLELARRGAVSSATALSPAGFWSKGEARFAAASLRGARAGATALEPLLPKLAANPIARSVLAGQLVANPAAVPPDALELAISGLIHSPGFERTREALFAETWSHRTALAAPATVAWAERDRLLLPRQARRAEAWIPGIRSISLRRCGHVPCWDDPALVARTLIEGSST